MLYQGKITTWKDDKGFGFITPDGGGPQIFLHISAFKNGKRRPAANDSVRYELRADVQGRVQAKNVLFSDERVTSSVLNVVKHGDLIFACSFIFFVFAASLSSYLPWAIFWLYLTASAITFLIYAKDKSAALNREWRVQENTLHLFALIGGWPGALVGQKLLHHKSKKQSFRFLFWATVIINCGALAFLFSQPGAATVHSWLDRLKELLRS